MADETTDRLRQMAAHRGLKLVASRRRKPGGDFGKFGLRDVSGKPVFGFDGEALVATAEEIESHLRGSASSAWSSSAKAVKAKPVTKPKSAPKPKPKPRLKPKVANLLAKLPAAKRAEAFTELLSRPGLHLERIVSQGQSTPANEPMLQDRDEWVLLLEGEAGLRIEDSAEIKLVPGDHLLIAAGQRHWVTFTAKDRTTIWLALHFG